MKVQALNLGKYDTTSTFRLYRLHMPASPPLNSPISTSPTMSEWKPDECAMYYYCLEDLERLVILGPSLRHVNIVQLYRDYSSAFFKNVIDGYTYANIHVLYKLASSLKSKLLIDLCHLTEQTPLTERYALLQRIPLLDITLLPSSSRFSHRPPIQLVEHVLHPVRLDGQEWFLQPWSQQQKLSPPQDEQAHLPKLSVTDMDSRTKESSLLLQRRLAPKLGHHAPHLTIRTPTYKDHYLHSVQSAPLRKSITKQQINKRLQAAASSGTMTHMYRSLENMGHPAMTATTEKQSFLRTFEQLHSTLEHTRTQKSTLDDTIRHTSVMLGKLQHSLTPQSIDHQVTKAMDEWMSPYLEQMEQCMGRLLTLEAKMASYQQQTPTIKMELVALMNRLEQLERTTPAQTG